MEVEDSVQQNHPSFEDIDDLEHPELYLGPEYSIQDDEDPEESHQDENKKNEAAKKSEDNKKLRLPVSRIKHIMKLDPEAGKISLEALVLATKATEMFIDALAKEAFTHTVGAKRKTLQKNDLDVAISAIDALFFLEGCFKTQ